MCSLHLILATVYQICEGDSAPLVDYQSCYDPIRVRDLTFGIRAFALSVGSRLINSVQVVFLVEDFSVCVHKYLKNTKNSLKIARTVVFFLF